MPQPSLPLHWRLPAWESRSISMWTHSPGFKSQLHPSQAHGPKQVRAQSEPLSSFIWEPTLPSGCKILASVNGQALQVRIQKYPSSQPHPRTPWPSWNPPFLKERGTSSSAKRYQVIPGHALYPPAFLQTQAKCRLSSLVSHLPTIPPLPQPVFIYTPPHSEGI